MGSEGSKGPLRDGDRLGRYEIVAYLASGGMAELYLARARGIEGFEKVVALKRILPKHVEDEDVVSMFLDEARLAATMHHPNLAQVYDIGKDSGSYFFTMEYIHGEDLDSVVRRAAKQGRGLSLASGLFIVTQVAAGLHHAHDRKGADGQALGTVHRDVSPSNVMISFGGAVKIVDFGVAKAVARRTKTRSGSIKGKIGYLSPEQARGEEIDRRSDVFALGILLFELTTGTRLFDQQHEYAVLTQLLTKDVPLPSSRRADYPLELEEIVLKALDREPSARFATAEELQLALEGFAREEKLALSNVSLGRFVRELFGDREDPTAVRALARGRDDPGGARATTQPGTLSGAASRPDIPLERGMSRAIWVGGAVLLIGAAVLVGRGWVDGEPSGPVTTAGAAATESAAATGTAGGAAGTAESLAASAAAPATNTADADDTVAEAGGVVDRSAGSSARRLAPPLPTQRSRPTHQHPPAASSAVVDSDDKHGSEQPSWDPGSVLPPVLNDE